MPCSPGIPEGLLIAATLVPEEFIMTDVVVVRILKENQWFAIYCIRRHCSHALRG